MENKRRTSNLLMLDTYRLISAAMCGMCGIVAQSIKRRERGLSLFLDTHTPRKWPGERGERSRKQASGYTPHAREG